MTEDITFCQNGWEECQVTRCERHPSNIENPRLPHSYAKFYRTEYCPLDKPQQPKFVKDINVPANDTISRQAAINAADRADYPGLAVEVVKAVTDEVIKELKQLPSAQPKPRWIPCSDRYPDMDERVLVYTVAHEYHVWDCMSNRADNYFWEDEAGLYHDKYVVDLWMPLPEPYKENT